jgi:hypothetical protein
VNTSERTTNKMLSFKVPKRWTNWAKRIAQESFGESECMYVLSKLILLVSYQALITSGMRFIKAER